MRRYQSGTLYEYYIVGVLIILAGVFLSQQHALFLLLVPVGIVIFFLPQILQLRETLRISARVRQEWDKLLATGFNPAAAVRARKSEGGAYLAIDAGAEKMAFVTEKGACIEDLAGIEKVLLKTHTLTQWGHEPRTRYDILFLPQDDQEGFGLSFPKKGPAARAFNKLNKALHGRIPITDQWQ